MLFYYRIFIIEGDIMARRMNEGPVQEKSQTEMSEVEALKEKIRLEKEQRKAEKLKRAEEERLKKEQEERELKEKQEKEFSDYIKGLFGEGFTDSEYEELAKRFNTLQQNYPLRTAMHVEALTTYIKYAFKRDKAIAEDDIESADKWGKLAAKQATDAKINPSQLSAADLSDGISNFGKLTEAVEREIDIIPILPKFATDPQDSLDFILWQFINYNRRLQNLPEVKYSEIYSFLDTNVKDYRKEYKFLVPFPKGDYEKDWGKN